MILSIQSVGFAIVLTDFSMGFQLITHLLDFLFLVHMIWAFLFNKDLKSMRLLETQKAIW